MKPREITLEGGMYGCYRIVCNGKTIGEAAPNSGGYMLSVKLPGIKQGIQVKEIGDVIPVAEKCMCTFAGIFYE